jgi:hypothetical protein
MEKEMNYPVNREICKTCWNYSDKIGDIIPPYLKEHEGKKFWLCGGNGGDFLIFDGDMIGACPFRKEHIEATKGVLVVSDKQRA